MMHLNSRMAVTIMMATATLMYATAWDYDFGTVTGSYNSASGSSELFLPAPPSGTARIRTGSQGGSFNLENAGLTAIGRGTELRMAAPTGTSVNKFSLYNYTAAKSFYTKFTLLLGTASGGQVSSGTYYFFQGDGSSFSNDSGYSGTDCFTGLRMTFGAGGTITLNYLSGSNWTVLGSTPFIQESVLVIEIFGNNTTSTIGYSYDGFSQNVGANKFDLWVNGGRYGNDLAKGGLSNNTNIDSFMFYGENSTGNAANLFLDDFTYENGISSVYRTYMNYFAKTSGSLNTPASWVSNQDGTGAVHPPNFTDGYVLYNIANNPGPTISSNWVVSGTNSRISVGNGSDATTFTIPASYTVTGIVDIQANGALRLQNTAIPALGTINPGSILEFNGNSAQTMNGRVDYSNVIINNPAGVGLVGEVVVNGNLVLSAGNLTTNGNALTVFGTLEREGGSCSSIGAVDGFTDANIGLSIAENGNLVSSLTVGVLSDEALLPDKIRRYWALSGMAAGEKTVTFSWTAADDMGYSWSETDRPVVYAGGVKQINGYVWNSLVPRQVSISILSFDAKGEWTIGKEIDNTLPVELSSFTAVVTARNLVRLDWTTQSETGLAGFYIFRNGVDNPGNAGVISPLVTASNTSMEQSYSFTDNEASAGIWYYWLQSLELDGQTLFHGPVAITLTSDEDSDTPAIPLVTSLQNIYPNPFNPNLTITYGLAKAEKVSIMVYNSRGERVRCLCEEFENSGNHRQAWDGRDDNARSLASGIYYLKFTAGKHCSGRKVILLK